MSKTSNGYPEIPMAEESTAPPLYTEHLAAASNLQGVSPYNNQFSLNSSTAGVVSIPLGNPSNAKEEAAPKCEPKLLGVPVSIILYVLNFMFLVNSFCTYLNVVHYYYRLSLAMFYATVLIHFGSAFSSLLGLYSTFGKFSGGIKMSCWTSFLTLLSAFGFWIYWACNRNGIDVQDFAPLRYAACGILVFLLVYCGNLYANWIKIAIDEKCAKAEPKLIGFSSTIFLHGIHAILLGNSIFSIIHGKYLNAAFVFFGILLILSNLLGFASIAGKSSEGVSKTSWACFLASLALLLTFVSKHTDLGMNRGSEILISLNSFFTLLAFSVVQYGTKYSLWLSSR